MDSITISRRGQQKKAVVSIPSSKSYIHRYLISALLAEGESVIDNVSFSNDIRATLSCIEALGATVGCCDNRISVTGAGGRQKSTVLDCGESASTLRFMIPVSTLLSENTEFIGSSTLLNRPLDPYFGIFDHNSMEYEFRPGEYLRLGGRFSRSEYIIDGSVSSQFVTGLLFTLPLMEFDSRLVIDGKLQSAPYVDITLEVLRASGIDITNSSYASFDIKGNQKYRSGSFFAQGDYSQVAFFLVAGCFAGNIDCINMEPRSLQGDRAIVDILKAMGANITCIPGGFHVERSALKSIGTIDATDIPDIVPVLSLACALSRGTTVIKGIERLKIKECDRAYATVDVLSNLGAEIREERGALVITGKDSLSGGRVSSFNDHRMAMTSAVAALVCDNPVTIEEPMSIRKSYPAFYDDLRSTGWINIERNE